MPYVLRQVAVGLAVVLAQWLLSNLGLWGVTPDVVLLYVAYVALRRGRVPGAVTGFWTGLLMDIVVNPSTLGVNALLKTLMGFVVGLFQSEQGEHLRLTPVQAFVGALVVAVVHNGLLTILLALDQGTRTPFLVFGLWLGGALYTAAVALVVALFRGR
ncbi:rod shape-determining protein MreD [Rubrivirga sp. S365]|uniref:Rod shape-determining protein MreD n=1 Tax=Rubrivirga litoralis TaxID=3075598 RepID=A0ABU3BN46_9BACT|nr:MULTISPECIES: rod shape-determining protein MreD [unclassified Rubrivirga]MDT0630717.1 rod shape-determining protein MreD [Rubrivirga sp. F394]MDT7856387.1 rod shape-determining protein MreD [Rubrivirga sp. S365]